MTEDKNKQLFLSLIYSFQMQTMMQLGKLANPMSGTIEKDLDAAQMTIDMLDMLKEKSKGNTTDDETRFLSQAIADLKLNFVEEREKTQKEIKPEDKQQPEIENSVPVSEETIPPAEDVKPPVEMDEKPPVAEDVKPSAEEKKSKAADKKKDKS